MTTQSISLPGKGAESAALAVSGARPPGVVVEAPALPVASVPATLVATCLSWGAISDLCMSESS